MTASVLFIDYIQRYKRQAKEGASCIFENKRIAGIQGLPCRLVNCQKQGYQEDIIVLAAPYA